MKIIFQQKPLLHASLMGLILLILAAGCRKNSGTSINSTSNPVLESKPPKLLKDYTQVNLVGNNNLYDPVRVDPMLINGWGIAMSPTGTIWISSAGAGVSVIYNKDGNQVLNPVTIPTHGGGPGGVPTGQTFNAGLGFRLANGNPARFIFVGADGVISGWNGGTAAISRVESPGAAYLGVTIATVGPDKFLYVANFAEAKIEVYDTAWNEVTMAFMDPTLPSGYGPFNIQVIENKLYVMYAKLGPPNTQAGQGEGFVSIFNPNGSFEKRFITRGQLNAPWGIAKAPPTFWGDADMENVILVGNFGDGRINAFDEDGRFIGQLRAHGNPIVIDKLWAITFPPATATTINPNWLYFAAGPDNEMNGLFGYVTKAE